MNILKNGYISFVSASFAVLMYWLMAILNTKDATLSQTSAVENKAFCIALTFPTKKNQQNYAISNKLISILEHSGHQSEFTSSFVPELSESL